MLDLKMAGHVAWHERDGAFSYHAIWSVISGRAFSACPPSLRLVRTRALFLISRRPQSKNHALFFHSLRPMESASTGCIQMQLGGMAGGALVGHYWADLYSVYGFRCYDNIAPNTKRQRVLVLALCLVANISV